MAGKDETGRGRAQVRAGPVEVLKVLSAFKQPLRSSIPSQMESPGTEHAAAAANTARQ